MVPGPGSPFEKNLELSLKPRKEMCFNVFYWKPCFLFQTYQVLKTNVRPK